MSRKGRVFFERFWRSFSKGIRYVPMSIAICVAINVIMLSSNGIPEWQTIAPRLFNNGIIAAVVGTWCATLASLYSAFRQLKEEQLVKSETAELKNRLGRFFGSVLIVSLVGMISGLAIAYQIVGIAFDSYYFFIAVLIGSVVSFCFIAFSFFRHSQREIVALHTVSQEQSSRVLAAQLEPHFLFNSLANMEELIETDSTRAAQFSQELAQLYRRILDSSKRMLSPLSAEIEIAKAYMFLQQTRFGNRCRFEMKVEEGLEEFKVPSLVVQTLLENAVKHAIAPCAAGGSIELNISSDRRETGGEGIRVEVLNTGEPLRQPVVNGTGIQSTLKRLQMHYGSRADFRLQSLAGNVTCASFYCSKRARHGD